MMSGQQLCFKSDVYGLVGTAKYYSVLDHSTRLLTQNNFSFCLFSFQVSSNVSAWPLCQTVPPPLRVCVLFTTLHLYPLMPLWNIQQLLQLQQRVCLLPSIPLPEWSLEIATL